MMHDIERRNRAICKYFLDQVGKGLPIMLAYVMTGEAFFQSEARSIGTNADLPSTSSGRSQKKMNLRLRMCKNCCNFAAEFDF